MMTRPCKGLGTVPSTQSMLNKATSTFVCCDRRGTGEVGLAVDRGADETQRHPKTTGSRAGGLGHPNTPYIELSDHPPPDGGPGRLGSLPLLGPAAW